MPSSEQERIDMVKHLEERFVKARKQLFDSFSNSIRLMLGGDMTLCERCSRFMVSRKLWDTMTKEERPLNLFTPVGSHGLCHPCYCADARRTGKSRKSPLSENELARLRRQVNIR